MVRSMIGGLVAGLAMFFIGFLFWGTPLSEIAFSRATDAESAAVQSVMAQQLTRGGTGTYVIPTPTTPDGTILYGRGPIAMVHFNTAGFAANDMSMMVPGLIFALVSGLLMAFGLGAVGRSSDFAARAQLVILFSLGMTIWTILAQPVFNNFGWGYWIYLFLSETIALIAGGLIIARWFVPSAPVVVEHRSESAPQPEQEQEQEQEPIREG